MLPFQPAKPSLQLNIVTRKHRCIVHLSDSVVDVGLIVRMDFANMASESQRQSSGAVSVSAFQVVTAALFRRG